MATWTKDPVTGEKTLTVAATAPKARCCIEVAEVKAALPEPAPFIMPTLLTEDALEAAYKDSD